MRNIKLRDSTYGGMVEGEGLFDTYESELMVKLDMLFQLIQVRYQKK